MTIKELLQTIRSVDIIFIISFIFLWLVPWAIGISLVVGEIINYFWSKLWKGMDEEKRYMWIKVAKW